MDRAIDKLLSITDAFVDVVIDQLLKHKRLQQLIDQRIDSKLKIAMTEETPGFLRLHEIVKHPLNPKPLIPISRSGFWARVKTGEYPQPVKLGPKTTAWKKEDIFRLIEQLESKKK